MAMIHFRVFLYFEIYLLKLLRKWKTHPQYAILTTPKPPWSWPCTPDPLSRVTSTLGNSWCGLLIPRIQEIGIRLRCAVDSEQPEEKQWINSCLKILSCYHSCYICFLLLFSLDAASSSLFSRPSAAGRSVLAVTYDIERNSICKGDRSWH